MLPPESTQQRAQKVTTLITEETIERRHSLRNMQAMGNVFKTEDEDEIFDNVYLGTIYVLSIDMTNMLKNRNYLYKILINPFFIQLI